jgi:hypothetical protein
MTKHQGSTRDILLGLLAEKSGAKTAEADNQWDEPVFTPEAPHNSATPDFEAVAKLCLAQNAILAKLPK